MTSIDTGPVFAELVSTPPAPGPGGRIQRTAGQAGSVLVLLELVLAFHWFGSNSWTERQVLAVTAVAFVLASAGQNLFNWWKDRRALMRAESPP